MSYTATWEHLLALADQANLKNKVKTGHWIWAYDNLNIHRSTRHERQDYQTGNTRFAASMNAKVKHTGEA